MPTVNTEAFSLALSAFVQEVGCGPEKHIDLVLDQAGWHKSSHLKIPEGLHQAEHDPEQEEHNDADTKWTPWGADISHAIFLS